MKNVSFIADSEQITLLYETYHLTHNVENATKCELIAKPRRIPNKSLLNILTNTPPMASPTHLNIIIGIAALAIVLGSHVIIAVN
jgi:hypothetical protein